jgi:tRNA dimethylallyltransferase
MADGIAVTGPTASGKSALAVAVAERLDGEIISMDSRQVYRGMDIGTAKPSREERERVPHHGLDLLSPDQRYSAGRFAVDAARWIEEIRGRGHVPVLAGGTGFFLRALTQPLFAEPPLDPARRDALRRYLDELSREELLRWLGGLDEAGAARLAHEGGRHRVARALEVALLTGRPLSHWHADQHDADPLRLLVFVLDLPRAELYDRINRRVDDMLAAGLVDEVRGLQAAGYAGSPGMNAVGYVELLPYLRGETTRDAAAEKIRTASRAYARRQLTWFRHQVENAVWLDGTLPCAQLVEIIVDAWRSCHGGAPEDRH